MRQLSPHCITTVKARTFITTTDPSDDPPWTAHYIPVYCLTAPCSIKSSSKSVDVIACLLPRVWQTVTQCNSQNHNPCSKRITIHDKTWVSHLLNVTIIVIVRLLSWAPGSVFGCQVTKTRHTSDGSALKKTKHSFKKHRPKRRNTLAWPYIPGVTLTPHPVRTWECLDLMSDVWKE